MLARLVGEKMKKENLSLREAGSQIKTSHTTITRILEGKQIDLKTLNSVCTWLNVSAADVLSEGGTEADVLTNKISLMVTREPKFRELFTQMVTEFEEGRLTSDEVNDIVAYAGYRMKLKEPK